MIQDRFEDEARSALERSWREGGTAKWPREGRRTQRRQLAPGVATFGAVEQLPLLGGIDVEDLVAGARWA